MTTNTDYPKINTIEYYNDTIVAEIGESYYNKEEGVSCRIIGEYWIDEDKVVLRRQLYDNEVDYVGDDDNIPYPKEVVNYIENFLRDKNNW